RTAPGLSRRSLGDLRRSRPAAQRGRAGRSRAAGWHARAAPAERRRTLHGAGGAGGGKRRGAAMRVAGAGGTRLLGRVGVGALTERGDQPQVLARSRGIDLMANTGLDQALAGCDAVVDVTNVTTTRAATAIRFFDTVTRNLIVAAQRAGVGHLLTVS